MSDETDRWRMIRHQLACRSGHRCELCGVHLGPGQEGTVHHRRPRGKGGSRASDVDSLANLLLLCGGALGGVLGCHGGVEESREQARTRGWLVPHGNTTDCDPAAVPVVLHGGRRVLLDPEQPFYLLPPDGAAFDTTMCGRHGV